MPQPTFAVSVTLRIRSEHIDSFRKRVLQQARDSVDREPGCHQFDVLIDESEPTVFVLYETYTDASAFDDHRSTPHFKDFDAQASDWIEAKNVHCLTLLEK
ncbi:Autoinducer 2-degrading protein LsrG [Novipirellula aureliae]|uniref:Autoinducer 2-degrading protein LsrG n=1 Tax=Novipirellula aureliae TaxID=2527966 RepID=A0A5C6E641_9BACT|nr:putative quinol monooxygenase [Novipirellula aureliae]TWU45153.1 Autoinducer 2-degrading protein LsrG [Novipirellula aureliae]